MPNRRIAYPAHAQTDFPITIIAEQLCLPIKTILYLASDGHIPLFLRTPTGQVRYASIHEDHVAPRSANLPPTADEKVSESPMGIADLAEEGLIGFFMSRDDCRELMYKGKISQSLFPSAVRKRPTHLKQVPPSFRPFPANGTHGLASAGWRVACFPKEIAPVLGTEGSIPAPKKFDITPNNLYAREEDIGALIDVIDSNLFLSDLVVEENGQTSDSAKITHVIDEKPAYISKKLVYLIETSERFWHASTRIDLNDYEAAREKVRCALQRPEFHAYFDKHSPSKGVIAAASQFIEPIFARANASDAEKQAWPWYLTPELLVLLAASKLYWSPPHIDLGEVATHPKNREIEAYLCSRGIPGNKADYAMTLIRPEGAARGRPVSKAPPSLQLTRSRIKI